MINDTFLNFSPAYQIITMMKRIYDKNMTTSSGGNLSIKDDLGNIWITPSQIDKGNLNEDDIVKITPNGKFIGKHSPSSEYPFHIAIYKNRPDICAIIHAHPVNLLAFVITDTKIDLDLIPELSNIIGKIGYADYAPVGSCELAKTVSSAFEKNTHTVMMKNHGIVTGDIDILKAYYRMESLNLLAYTILKSNQLEKINPKNSVINEDYVNLKFISSDNENIDLKKKLIYYAKRSYNKNLTTAVSGSFSIRINSDYFLIIPKEIDKLHLTTKNIYSFRISDITGSKQLSNDIYIHALIYKNNPNINTLIFATPQNIIPFICGKYISKFNLKSIPESSIVLKNFETISYNDRYLNPSILSSKISLDTPCLLCKNSGLIVAGDNLFQAFDRIEVAEATAHSLLNADLIGNVNQIKY